MGELTTIFNQIKNLLDAGLKLKISLISIEKLVVAKDLSDHDKEILEGVFSSTSLIMVSLNSLAKKAFEIGSKIYSKNSTSIVYIDTIGSEAKNILILIDKIIDSFINIVLKIDLEEDRFKIKIFLAYLRAMRNCYVKISKEYSDLLIKTQRDEEKFCHFVNSTIDFFIREGNKIKISEIHDKIKIRLGK